MIFSTYASNFLMQKYEKSAEIYYLSREGRYLVKNDMASLATVKSKIMAAENYIVWSKIVRMILYHGQIPYNDLMKLMSKQIARWKFALRQNS